MIDGQGQNPEARRISDYPGFDWLRIVLASIVVLGHEGVVFPGAIDGELAVQVFFALSGWLIGGILLKTQRDQAPRFFFNRATRIWISYLAAIGLLYGSAALLEGVGDFWAKYLFYDLTFTHQIFTRFPAATFEMPLGGSGNQFWSISVEEQFYLIAPILMLLVPTGKKLWLWLVVAILAFALRTGGLSISLGVMAAILRRDMGDWHLARDGRIAVLAAAVVLLTTLMFVDNGLLRSLFAISVVLALAVPGRRRPLPMLLGGISYPLYLNHWAGAFVANGILKHVLHLSPGAGYGVTTFVLLAYPISFAIGAGAYFAIDRSVLAHRDGWFTPLRGRILGATAYTLVTVGLIGGAVIGAR